MIDLTERQQANEDLANSAYTLPVVVCPKGHSYEGEPGERCKLCIEAHYDAIGIPRATVVRYSEHPLPSRIS